MPTEEEEFELIPMSPLRRLERRLEKIESTKGSGIDVKEFFSQFVEIVKLNQQLVDELAKSSDALRIEISKLPGRLDELINDVSELISFIKTSAGAESAEAVAAGTNLEPLLKKMDALIEGNTKIVESNESMMAAVDNLSTRFKRPGLHMVRMPLGPTRPRLSPLKKKF